MFISQNKIDEAKAILAKLYPPEVVEIEMKALQSSVEEEIALEGSLGESSSMVSKLRSALRDKVVRRGLYAGITVQVVQQFVGINTIMYYSPTIVQFAGFASKKTALALSLVIAGLNAIGSVVSMMYVDKYGRRRLMIISLFGIIICLAATSLIFHQAATHSPLIDQHQSTNFSMPNSTCPAYISASNSNSWNCMSCLKAKCGFCANGNNEVCMHADC